MSRFYNCDHNSETLSGASLQVTNHLHVLSKTEEPEQSLSVATPEFLPRRISWKPTMKEDVFCSAPKRVVNSLSVETVEKKSNEIGLILAKKRRYRLGSGKIEVPRVF